ncbi:hypothetical protein [Kribbella sp. NPDC055071]
MTLWLSLFAATWVVYVVLALLSARGSGREAGEVLAAVVATSGAFFARTGIEGTSLLGALRGATLVSLLIIVITGGRPARVFDPPGMKARAYRRLSREDRDAIDRRDRASCLTQLVLTVCIIGGVTAYVFAGWTFLD